MADDPNKPAANSGIPQAEHDAAVAAARAEGHAEGVKAGATAERDRFKAVSSSEHYQGREASAHHMLLTTDMSAEQINGVLAGIPAGQSTATPAASLANRIAATTADPLATADQPDAAKAQAGWGKAVAQANGRFGKDAV